jgi:hypothetical protein
MNAERIKRALRVLYSDCLELDCYEDEELFEIVGDVERILREAACAVAFPALQGFTLNANPTSRDVQSSYDPHSDAVRETQ